MSASYGSPMPPPDSDLAAPAFVDAPTATLGPIWVVVLTPGGTVVSVQALGQETMPKGLTQHWIGRTLTEMVAFTEGNALSPLFSYPDQHSSSPKTLVGRCPLGAYSLEATWVFQPLLTPDGQGQGVIATAYWADSPLWQEAMAEESQPLAEGIAQAIDVSQAGPLAQLQSYAPRLNQITRNVRWTLDLDTIQRQTVEGLGDLFQADRCLICTVPADSPSALVAAEYLLRPDWPQWLGQPLPPSEQGHLERAAQYAGAILDPVSPEGVAQMAVEEGDIVRGKQASVLAVATRYQNQINGFILIYDVNGRPWTGVELGLITDLADQVGTAIAHAQRFAESHALAIKLQQANASLLEKQREFQEARRQAEEARQQAEEASRLKSEFLANTSHELRTPLNGIIGFLKLVLDGMADDPEEQQDFLQEAHKSAIHLLELINDVLDIAKIEAGKMQIDMRPVNLKELLANVENFARPLAEQKGLEFKMLLPATRDEITLNGNYQRLLQVLLNLVGNAVKFTHEGTITIQAEVKPQKAEYQGNTWPGTVKISVIDTGIGVSLEKQDRLFQSFSQVDGERTRQYGGTGLGLAISQRLVEAMGGTVHFISMGEGLGSTVTFTALLYQAPVMIDRDPVYPAS